MDSVVQQLKYRVKDIEERGEDSLLFSLIKTDLTNQILLTNVNQKEDRENLYLMAHGLSLLERKIQEFVNDLNEESK